MYTKLMIAAGLAFAATAHADPVAPTAHGTTVGNSFSQIWNQDNWGFNALAFEFVSQSPFQSSFETAPSDFTNGWSGAGGDLNLAFATGTYPNGTDFTLNFFGDLSDTVSWNIWYYLGSEKLGGYRFDGLGSQAGGFTWIEPSGGQPDLSIPLPSGAMMAGVGLFGLASVRRRRA